MVALLRTNLSARSLNASVHGILCEEYACSGESCQDQSGVLASEWRKIGSSINAALYLATRSPPGRSLALMIGVLHFFLGDNPERTRFVAEIVKSGEELNDIHRFPGFEEARVSRNRLLFVVHCYTV